MPIQVTLHSLLWETSLDVPKALCRWEKWQDKPFLMLVMMLIRPVTFRILNFSVKWIGSSFHRWILVWSGDWSTVVLQRNINCDCISKSMDFFVVGKIEIFHLKISNAFPFGRYSMHQCKLPHRLNLKFATNLLANRMRLFGMLLLLFFCSNTKKVYLPHSKRC